MGKKEIIAMESIENRILLLRGQRVMLDRDLAELYDVETKNLNRQVKRNRARFPDEFMFRLNGKEKKELVTNWHRFNSLKHSSALPYVFTEFGAVMLASVLNSPKAAEVSVFVVRAFIRLREILSAHKELAGKINDLELKIETHSVQITEIIEAINQLLTPPAKTVKKIGFEIKDKKNEYDNR
jgi:ORF6N domain